MSRVGRFPAVRVVRIGGWTAMATAWVAAVIARVSGVGGAATAASTIPDPVSPAAVEQSADVRAALPAMPEGGLLVLRIGRSSVGEVTLPSTPPMAPAAPEIVPAPPPIAAPQVVPVPPTVTSSGS